MRLSIINGPNLNLLGKREPEIYGTETFESFLEELKNRFPEITFDYFQSNEEGKLITKIQELSTEGTDGFVLNAAAYSHTSIALADTVNAIPQPVVEVHISNIFSRESFRRHSYLTEKCVGIISGLGMEGYALAVHYLKQSLSNKSSR